MTKKDLRTGMVVTCRNGNRYLYIKDYPECEDGIGIGLTEHEDWLNLKYQNNDLTRGAICLSPNRDYDIVKVEKIKLKTDFRRCFTDSELELIVVWTREPEEFKVVCVEQITGEKNFTVGKIYTWKNDTLTGDDGYVYDTIVSGTNLDKWELSYYYKFIKVVE